MKNWVFLMWLSVFFLYAGTFNPKTMGLFFQNEAVGASWRQTASLSLSDSKMLVNSPKKSNNFEPFFGDSALTFLTFGNTFRLQILPTRRLVLLRGRERKIWGRQIKIRGRQIFPGCAPKIAVFKGKVTKKREEPRLLPYLCTNIIHFIAKSKKC